MIFVTVLTASKPWSRHNKRLEAVGMSIGNLSGKPLNADFGHFKNWVCNELYVGYVFIFIKFIEIGNPTDIQLWREITQK